MKIERFRCDVEGCQQERAGDKSLYVYSHSTPDASGNGSEHWQAVFDLCARHLLDFSQALIYNVEDKKSPIKLLALLDNLQIKSRIL